MLLLFFSSDLCAMGDHSLCTAEAKVPTSAGFWNFAKRASGKLHADGKTDAHASMLRKPPWP